MPCSYTAKFYHLLYSFFFLVLLASPTLAQDSIPDYFAAQSRWVELTGHHNENPNPDRIELYINGDSTLDGKKYYKLLANVVHQYPFDQRTGKALQGLIRQEGQKVFYRGFFLDPVPLLNIQYPITNSSALPTQEILLFDCSLNIGDTINLKNHPQYYNYAQQEEDSLFVVDTVYHGPDKIYPHYNTKSLKFKNLDRTFGFWWVEATGNTSHFLKEMQNRYGYTFLCYQNDSTQFLDTSERGFVYDFYEECDFLSSIRSSHTLNQNIYYRQQQLIHPQMAIEKYSIFNSMGQLVQEGENLNATENISVKTLTPGLFILHFKVPHYPKGVLKFIKE